MLTQKIYISLLFILVLIAVFITVCSKDENPTGIDDKTRDAKIQTLVESAGDYAEADTNYVETKEEVEKVENNVLYLCTRKSVDASLARGRFTLFDPNSEVIWPGSALQGKSIQYHTPDPIIAPRAGGKIIINNITGTETSSVEIEKATHSNVLDAANEIIRSQSDKFPAQLSLSYTRVRSKEELALSLSAGGGFFDLFEANSNFELEESGEVTTYLITLFQSYYTLIFERPERASDFFAKDVTVEDLNPFIGEGNYPVYVSSVTYGRVYYFLISSTESASEVSASVSASFDLGFLDVGGSGYYNQVKDLSQLRVQAWAYGGDTGTALSAITGNLYRFLEEVKNDNNIKLAKPVSYAIRTVRSATLVKNEIYTKFTVVSDCRPYVLSDLDILIEPRSLYFGCVERDQTAIKNLKITNRGTINIEIELIPCRCGMSRTGTRPICFPITPSEPFVLQPNQSKEVQVKFSPYFYPFSACWGELDGPMTMKAKTKSGEIETIIWIEGKGALTCP